MNDGTNSEGAKKRRCFSWSGLVLGAGIGSLLSVTPSALLWWFLVLFATIIGLAMRSRLVASMALAAAGVMAVATALPTKYEDKQVGPLKSPKLTVHDLVEAGLARDPRDFSWTSEPIQLDSISPRRRDLIKAINEQTSLRARYFGCGTGATCWDGAKGGQIILSAKRANPVAGSNTAPAAK